MRHINIPIFIPHLGCPNQCIFCNQRYISGNEKFDESSVRREIDTVLSTVSGEDFCEIAFFGGSFTGIDRELMVRLLDLAQEYVDEGLVKGIRMSTRPDYISEEIIDILKKYSVTYVELGIQSMNDNILTYLKRGHTVKDTEKAVALLKRADILFVGQMMIGLPNATSEDEIYCAERICELGASAVRIYPTLVFKMTELEEITLRNEYNPLSCDEAIERSARVLRVFINSDIPCIRIGLSDSENLHSNDTFVAGPNEPSIGEMVKSRLFYNIICDKVSDFSGESIVIECAKGKTSQIIGNKRKNLIEIKNKFNLRDVKVIENKNLNQYDIKILKKEEAVCV
ncbi:MAG: radical SAM protein [Clostridia bacterium]|nr:radical SAM protein [Clostridia bacterium]